MTSSAWNAQKSGWRTLRGLRPAAIDLECLSLIRQKPPEYFTRADNLEALLLELGLNDEGMDEFPPALHPYCGRGLRIWQYPSQFSKYLAHLCGLQIRSYVELGIRHGGSFATTVEVLN